MQHEIMWPELELFVFVLQMAELLHVSSTSMDDIATTMITEVITSHV